LQNADVHQTVDVHHCYSFVGGAAKPHAGGGESTTSLKRKGKGQFPFSLGMKITAANRECFTK